MTPAPRNRTIGLTDDELREYQKRLTTIGGPQSLSAVVDRVIHGDTTGLVDFLPDRCVDLLFLDPPYNLTKEFGDLRFNKTTSSAYAGWVDSWLAPLVRVLKPGASIYICGDWRSSSAIQSAAERHFTVRSRITWEREKGRGAKANWKNASEDLWFCTMGDSYTFNVDQVRLRRKVLAPYVDATGKPKDWTDGAAGRYRDTGPSNLWTDLSVPFWSMPENTEHPTQKPEKLLARIVLASSNAGDVVLDPFLGSGTAAAVAKKLRRRFIGIESNLRFACLAQKRVELAEVGGAIQGLVDGVFWERNSAPPPKVRSARSDQNRLLD
ncbi:MAG: site-specific DNA-methyltransferase [Anaerolinea sp.]|nr:site-specific DNA-methyltransferase [Anaerolinea sp.]